MVEKNGECSESWTKYVAPEIAKIITARIDPTAEKQQNLGQDLNQKHSELQTFLQVWGFAEYPNICPSVLRILHELKQEEMALKKETRNDQAKLTREEKINFISNFTLLYAQETKEKCQQLQTENLIKYTLAAQLILYKYYEQIPKLVSIRELEIIPEFLEIYKILLAEELENEKRRKNVRFKFEIKIPDEKINIADIEKNIKQKITKLQIKVENFEKFDETEKTTCKNFLCEFLGKYNNFFVKFNNLSCNLKP